MPESATPSIRFGVSLDRPLDVRCNAGGVTSDGGLAWLGDAEAEIGGCAALAARVPEWRRGRPCHSRRPMVSQRVFPIACGFADQGDADTLRHGPLLNAVCGRLPASDPDLASQPTMSRLENAVDHGACFGLAVPLWEAYLRERERAGIPARIALDLDCTDDPTHRHRECVTLRRRRATPPHEVVDTRG